MRYADIAAALMWPIAVLIVIGYVFLELSRALS
jgi:hypothetical protein